MLLQALAFLNFKRKVIVSRYDRFCSAFSQKGSQILTRPLNQQGPCCWQTGPSIEWNQRHRIQSTWKVYLHLIWKIATDLVWKVSSASHMEGYYSPGSIGDVGSKVAAVHNGLPGLGSGTWQPGQPAQNKIRNMPSDLIDKWFNTHVSLLRACMIS